MIIIIIITSTITIIIITSTIIIISSIYLTLGQVHGREPNKYIPVEKMIEMGLEKLVQQCDSKVRCRVTYISYYYYIDVSIICIYVLLFLCSNNQHPYLSKHLSIYLSIHLSIFPSICLSIYSSISLSIYSSI